MFSFKFFFYFKFLPLISQNVFLTRQSSIHKQHNESSFTIVASREFFEKCIRFSFFLNLSRLLLEFNVCNTFSFTKNSFQFKVTKLCWLIHGRDEIEFNLLYAKLSATRRGWNKKFALDQRLIGSKRGNFFARCCTVDWCETNEWSTN